MEVHFDEHWNDPVVKTDDLRRDKTDSRQGLANVKSVTAMNCLVNDSAFSPSGFYAELRVKESELSNSTVIQEAEANSKEQQSDVQTARRVVEQPVKKCNSGCLNQSDGDNQSTGDVETEVMAERMSVY